MDGSEQDRNHIENKGKGSSHAVPIPLLNNLIHLHWQSSVPCVSWVWFPQSAQVFLLFAVIALSQLPCRLHPCELLPGNDADLRGQQPEDKQGRDGSRSTSVRVQLCHSLALCPWSKPLASLTLQEEDLPPAVTWSQWLSWDSRVNKSQRL